MAEEKAMAEKILSTIESIIDNDPDLEDFTIIPTEDNTKNKSPVLYEQHNIGLESWCVKHVYNYACSILFDHRELLSRQKIPYNKMENLNRLLIGAILINPDVGTFWNMKRELVLSDVLKVESELHFCKIVLTHKSKSNEAFSYRRWLIRGVLEEISSHDIQTPLDLLRNELLVVNMASGKAPNNYHSWNHRIWCMENITANSPNISIIINSELNYSQEWINLHISEHAGYHYRQYLLKLVKSHKNVTCLYELYYNFVINHLELINDGEPSNLLTYLLGKQNKSRLLEEIHSYINYIAILLYDLFIVTDKLNRLFPEHESLFYHRRFLVYHLLEVIYEYHGNDFQTRNKVIESDISITTKNIVSADVVVSLKSLNGNECNQWAKLGKVEACNLHKMILNSEKQFLCENLNINYGPVQNELAKRYQKWLRYVIGFE